MDQLSDRKFRILMQVNAVRNHVPMLGHFELTPLCNLDCKMCYVHLQDPALKERLLPGDRWIALMQEAITLGMTNAILTGGEAMTHPDFWKIYMYLVEQGIRVAIKSNGLMLTDEAIARFKEYPPEHIDISLYGCDRESYLAVTGVDAFETVTASIHRVIDAGINLRVMITPSKYMLPWVEQVMETARSFGTQVVVNSLLIEPNDETGRSIEEIGLTREDNEKIYKLKNQLFPPQYLTTEEENELQEFREVHAAVPRETNKGLQCYGGRTGFAVHWDGSMGPCLEFPGYLVSTHPFETGFAKAWDDVTAYVNNYELPDDCASCEVKERCHYCPTQHGRLSIAHQCSEDVCAYWKMVYAE